MIKASIIKKTKFLAAAFLSATAVLSGCGAVSDDEPLIVLESGDAPADYVLVECVRNDIVSTKPLRCIYRKNQEQEVFFPVSGKVIDKVYVKVGDEVKKGDILVELSIGNLESRIRDLEYSIARNKLLLGYIDEDEVLDSQSIWLGYLYQSRKTEDDKERAEDQVENLKKQNEYSRENYSDSIEFDTRKLNALKEEYRSARVYADFDGKVSSIEDRLEGSTSNATKCIMTIVDNSEGYFETETDDLREYFHEGEAVSMKVVLGNGKGEYELVPLNMDSWGDTLTFSILSGENADSLEAGAKGDMAVVVDKRENVLTLPSDCVRNAGDDSYVYVMNEQGLREVVWVETGLSGNGITEIVSGLNEGDSVIKR